MNSSITIRHLRNHDLCILLTSTGGTYISFFKATTLWTWMRVTGFGVYATVFFDISERVIKTRLPPWNWKTTLLTTSVRTDRRKSACRIAAEYICYIRDAPLFWYQMFRAHLHWVSWNKTRVIATANQRRIHQRTNRKGSLKISDDRVTVVF